MAAEWVGGAIKLVDYLVTPLTWSFARLFPRAADPIKFVHLDSDSEWSAAGNAGERHQHAYIRGFYYVTNLGRNPVTFVEYQCISHLSAKPTMNIRAYPALEHGESAIRSFEFFLRNRDWSDDTKLRLRILVKDNLNRRWTLAAHCASRTSKPPERIEVESEVDVQTEDEKVLVAILKDEVNAYRNNGRREGGIGSLGKHGGMNFSSKNLQLATKLVSSESKDLNLMLECLRIRMVERLEYVSIAYFFLAVLFECKRLESFFNWAAHREWPRSGHALSDAAIALSRIIQTHGERLTETDLNMIQARNADFQDADGLPVSDSVMQAIRAERIRRARTRYEASPP